MQRDNPSEKEETVTNAGATLAFKGATLVKK